jgi:protein-tyrosine phosphatase
MHQIPGYALWLGHAGDARDVRRLLAEGIVAVVDLALNEAPLSLPRELTYCRFPLLDGAGNPPWLVRAAVEAVAGFVASRTPTLVSCSNGMSRSPAVAATALARAEGRAPAECLEQIAAVGAHDVSPGLWQEVLGTLEA